MTFAPQVAQNLKIRNTLDLMHCKKNFAENVLKTICGVKEKDIVHVHCNMQQQGIQKHLWLTKHPTSENSMVKLAALYVLTSEEFNKFCTRLESLKTPIGYYSKLDNAI